jgi:hypothetical protein
MSDETQIVNWSTQVLHETPPGKHKTRETEDCKKNDGWKCKIFSSKFVARMYRIKATATFRAHKTNDVS